MIAFLQLQGDLCPHPAANSHAHITSLYNTHTTIPHNHAVLVIHSTNPHHPIPGTGAHPAPGPAVPACQEDGAAERVTARAAERHQGHG